PMNAWDLWCGGKFANGRASMLTPCSRLGDMRRGGRVTPLLPMDISFELVLLHNVKLSPL
ncbi:MAG: hypothetical protein WAM53_19575, partial [Terrimicrobiaceae bacterium]